MAEGGEMRGFVFSIVFIIVFATLLSTIPVGLQGLGETPDGIVPISPSLLTGFNDYENFTRADCTPTAGVYIYNYDLNDRAWVFAETFGSMTLFAKVLFAGFLWLGQVDDCKFISSDGQDRGDGLTFTEIAADADDGEIRYEMQFTTTGDDAGSLVIYWNTTTYSDPEDAWDNDILYLLHGVGFHASATTNIGSLIVSLLMLQLPGVPVLVNLFLAVPIWACIVYVLWYIIKEMIPFV